ncbi:hypothetical protein F5890DRAFT_1560673 [Lentinula detonsa]|uniref:Uncharacterized protein n=1 Tax=Lentinula detonsa TaxID=2804962 RepID=A0AA38PNA3_9AGAR|nr:hypothetical protein F5890DRAFT_1560673 [Lentinula detonsa]
MVGVPRTTVDVENYVFPDGSQSSNIDNAGHYADYSVVLTFVRPIAQQLAAHSNTFPIASAGATQSVGAPSTEDHAIEMAPCIIDWDDTQFNATGDPVIDYGEDDGMDMAGYTQPQEQGLRPRALNLGEELLLTEFQIGNISFNASDLFDQVDDAVAIHNNLPPEFADTGWTESDSAPVTTNHENIQTPLSPLSPSQSPPIQQLQPPADCQRLDSFYTKPGVTQRE